MSDLKESIRDTGLRRWQVIKAVSAGTMALGSAVGLAAVAAWLIAKAAEMPSPADIALAAVIVRFFGISRGLFRYLERLASHDAALRGVVTLRERTYASLAASGSRTILGLRRGDILARLGADLDAIGDAVVRAIIPTWVALTVSALAVAIVGYFSLLAAAALALCLALAALLPGLLTARASRIAAERGGAAQAEVSAAVHSSLDAASEHLVWDTTGAVRDELRAANREAEAAADAAAGPSAWAAGLQSLASGAALVLAVGIGITAATAGNLSGPGAAVVALTPLAAFEAVGAIPTAMSQYFRSRFAARRVRAMTGQSADASTATTATTRTSRTAATTTTAAPAPAPVLVPPVLEISALRAGWLASEEGEASIPTRPVSVRVEPGTSLGLIGRSGVGKTTMLLTIAGALEPVAGTVTLDGASVGEETTGRTVAMTAEDAHVFGTSVLENLRVARGDVTVDDATEALDTVGLTAWVAGLPAGLDTVLGSGGGSISGGERRRLLLARVLVTPAPIHLIDEPGEHLDAAGRDALRAVLDTMRKCGRSVVIVTHDVSLLDRADQVIDLDE
ncbi:thiol reductant ABC exporter subunit CydC [Demequina oxidasica]|uniref:thiol reductant ABC exporter subunit CydC n=1 Tax=Demequina oxidasica TaxID=676199 RepID=UPI00078226F7|nr:thiol reductant ABC exporter subunit CydC [Demequina oxidasica]